MADRKVYAMAVAPHPFDNDMGLGGTVARWVREGKDVVYVICTNGDKFSMDPAVQPEELAIARRQEQLAAAKILGVKEVVFLGHPDLTLEYTPALRNELLGLVLKYRPEVITTNDPYYRAQGYFSSGDHRNAGQATLDVVWPYILAPGTYRHLIEPGYQLHKIKEVLMWQTENANHTEDITETLELKIEAIGCYKTQMLEPSDSQFAERLRERASKLAEGKGYKYGEAFHRVEPLQRL